MERAEKTESIEYRTEREVRILWSILLQNQDMPKMPFSSFDPFLCGVSAGAFRFLGYNFQNAGVFPDYVCEELKVFNWHVINEQMEGVPLNSPEWRTRIRELIAREESRSKYVAQNWLSAIARECSDDEGVAFFYRMLRSFRPDLYKKEYKMPLLTEGRKTVLIGPGMILQ